MHKIRKTCLHVLAGHGRCDAFGEGFLLSEPACSFRREVLHEAGLEVAWRNVSGPLPCVGFNTSISIFLPLLGLGGLSTGLRLWTLCSTHPCGRIDPACSWGAITQRQAPGGGNVLLCSTQWAFQKCTVKSVNWTRHPFPDYFTGLS